MTQTVLAWPVHLMMETPGGCQLLAPQYQEHCSGDAYARELFHPPFPHFLRQNAIGWPNFSLGLVCCI